MVPEPEFTSYYGRAVVKPAPWGPGIAAYLFLGGVAGGSAVLGAGAQLTGRATLCRNCRLAALGAVSLGAVALVEDLGRPERFLNMLRVIKEYPQGWGSTNSPPADILVSRDTSWFVHGYDYFLPDFFLAGFFLRMREVYHRHASRAIPPTRLSLASD